MKRTHRTDTPMKISDILTERLVKTGLESTDKDGLFREMIQLFVDQGLLNSGEEALAALRDRESKMTTGIANGLRARLFIEIEQGTRTFALPRLRAGDGTTRRALTDAITKLEHDVGLLRLNLNESAALENFLLSSLRLWTRK